MKKALVIFLALAMVCSVFAAEPAAEVSIAEFKGDASVTFGFDLDTLKTGFKNETSGSLKLNLLKGGEKSTAGDGVWGELKIKIKDIQIAAKADKAAALEDDKKVSIEVAKIHFGPVYMGIKSDDFDYGGDFLFPNALNYKDDKDDFVKNPAKKLGYDQGFILGYKHKSDIVKVEASFRSKKETSEKLDKVEALFLKKDDKIKEGEYYTTAEGAFDKDTAKDYFTAGASNLDATTDPKVKKLKATALVYKRVMKDDKTTYWTNKYAVGLYAEVKPIKDLRIGLGGAYVIGNLNTSVKDDADNKNDISVFAGTDYRFNINEKFFIQPAVAYTLYCDYLAKSDAYNIATNKLGMGLRFGFGGSKDSNSLLKDFFGKEMVYNSKKEDDKILLPGVSVFSEVDFTQNNLAKKIPLLVSFYSGEIVKGLNTAAFAYARLGYAFGSDEDKDVQTGAAASYDIKAGDITIVPALGVLFSYDKNGSNNTYELGTEAKVDVKGLVDNTTFTLAWGNDRYTFGTGAKHKNGEITLKAKIAL